MSSKPGSVSAASNKHHEPAVDSVGYPESPEFIRCALAQLEKALEMIPTSKEETAPHVMARRIAPYLFDCEVDPPSK